MVWTKGQSGNPGGKRKTRPITDAIAAALKERPHNGKATNLDLMVANLIQTSQMFGKAEAIAAAKLILSYIEGLPVQKIDIDMKQEAERLAAEHGMDPERLISLAEELKKRRAS